ncbi:hypothetical protein H0H92_006378 [Tricholoma furcatifolium]|nr:hypothetical protein H0H92_006378 [Tricholoma furcatifolium]
MYHFNCTWFDPGRTIAKTPPVSCQRWFWFIGYNGPVLSTAVGEFLLLARVNALYGFNRKVMVVTSLLYLLETSLSFATVAIQVSSISVLPRTSATPVPGCLATSPPRIKLSLIAWIVALVLTLVLFSMSLFKFYDSMAFFEEHSRSKFKTIFRASRIMPTLSLFIRDNSFFFFCAFNLHLLNLIFIVVLADRPLQQIGTAWIMAGYAVMSSRLMLNIRHMPRSSGIANESFEMNLRSGLSATMPRFHYAANTETTAYSGDGRAY